MEPVYLVKGKLPYSAKYLRDKISAVFTIYSLSTNFSHELSVEQYNLIQVMSTTQNFFHE